MTDLPVFRWGKWPPHLLTKAQMSEAGFQTGQRLPPPAAQVYRSKSPGGVMYLYDRAQGVPKRPITDAQRETLRKAAEKSSAGWYCTRCGQPTGYVNSRGRFYAVHKNPPGLCLICECRKLSIEWARDLLEKRDFVILDTETTGLAAGHDEIVQIAVIDHTGKTLLDTYVKPQHPERLTERTNGRSASDINGITPDMLTSAPTWPEVYSKLSPLLVDKTLVIYNAQYDTAMIDGDCDRHNITHPDLSDVNCAMLMYAEYCGEWSSYHNSFKWQPLNGGHTALDDCLATLKLIQEMAEAEE